MSVCSDMGGSDQPLNFDLPSDLEAIQRTARAIGAKLAPGYLDRDIDGEPPRAALRMLADSGLLGLNVASEAGGQGIGELASGIACEELGYGDYCAGIMLINAGNAAKILHRFAQPALAERWIPKLLGGKTVVDLALTEPSAGSDISAIASRAIRAENGWRLRGEKNSVSCHWGSATIALARADGEPALFWVPTDASGLVIAPYDDLGTRPLGRAVMTFDDVEVPDDARLTHGREGLRAVLDTLMASRVLLCMVAIGVARAALDDAVQWAKDRVTNGAPLAARQGIAFPLCDHLTEIEKARLLCHKALRLADQGRPFDVESAMAKSSIPPAMVDVCHTAMLTVGHAAYARAHAAQLRLRDLIGTELATGATNIQRIILSRRLLGRTPG